jgi:outer membrane murein-binding lipoprotein Lpp
MAIAAAMLAGCVAELPAAATVPQHPPPRAAERPIKRDVQEIKTAIDKLKRDLDGRGKLAPQREP